MKHACAALSLGLIATPAAAQGFDQARLVQVKPGPKRYFYQEYEDGCPARSAKCRIAAYVVAGDRLVARGERNGFAEVEFVNARGRTTRGWIETAALAPVPLPAASTASWRGNWSHSEGSIQIKATRRAEWLSVHGDATWGSFDPERVRRGGINLGELDGAITVAGGRIVSASGDIVLSVPSEDASACNVRFRLLGPYLLAEDNGHCGGHNVSFSGAYRRL